MKTKLTVTMEPELIKAIKKYAKAEGRSVSDVARNYFMFISGFRTQAKSNLPDTKIASIVKKLSS